MSILKDTLKIFQKTNNIEKTKANSEFFKYLKKETQNLQKENPNKTPNEYSQLLTEKLKRTLENKTNNIIFYNMPSDSLPQELSERAFNTLKTPEKGNSVRNWYTALRDKLLHSGSRSSNSHHFH